MTSLVVIRGGHIVDPATGRDGPGEVWLRNSRIASPAHSLDGATLIDATGCLVCPGFVDLHAALRDPGFEEDEATSTGAAAALAGGFTTVCATPDTQPVTDNRASAEFIVLQAKRAAQARVLPLGAVTRGRLGLELADLGQLVDGGAVGFTDAKSPIASAEILRRALEYSRRFGRPILTHPQDPALTAIGQMHEGSFSTILGLRGMPSAAEKIMVARDIALAELTGGHVHLMCISTRDAVDEIRRAKARGVRVTADVTPHHLLLNDAHLQGYDSHYKVTPPLRTPNHVAALREGLLDGTLDAITADHQPVAREKKEVEFDQAPFGISGLETVLALCATEFVSTGLLTWPELIARLALHPARILGLSAGTLEEGSPADVVLLNPQAPWTIDPTQFRSRSRNTPFAGRRVTTRVEAAWVGGELRYSHADWKLRS